MFLSSRQGRKFVAVGAGAGLDEGPDPVAADGDVVEAVVEADRDRLTSGRAAVGEVGVADAAARSLGSEVAEWACAGGARAVPASAAPLPHLGFQLSAVAVPVHDREAVIAVAGDRQDAGVTGVPAAVSKDLLLGQARVVRWHRQARRCAVLCGSPGRAGRCGAWRG